LIRALSLPARKGRRRPEAFRVTTAVIAAAAPVVLVTIAVLLARQGWPAISRFGPGFLVASAWNPVKEDFGALPLIAGTLLSSAIALLLAVPVGVAVAVFLAEGRAGGFRGAIGTGVELLAAIPSVVYGLWALFVMAPFLYLHVEVPVSERFGSFAVLAGPPRQTSLFSAGVVLAVMILPTLAAVSRDVIRAVPSGLREASFALGSTWWETTWRVVLPAARAGIFGAIVLALGRALGETIAVTMVIGNRPDIPRSLFSPAYTLASVIANEFTEATGRLYPAALIELGLILMLVTLAVNLGATLLVRPSPPASAG
jgi:phosphate transport system permease protein